MSGMSQQEFCDRFVAEMVRIAGPKDANGDDVVEYARETAPSYFEEEWQREEGPEACAQADHSYWELEV